MWTCECGCKGIAVDLAACPMCSKENEMPKTTVAGASNRWENTGEATQETVPAPVEPVTEVEQPELPVEPEEAATADTPVAAEVRAWAKENGLDVSDRGAIPAAVMEQYAEAHRED